LLPVHTAVACARALHGEFASSMQQLGIISESLPSLSVGLGLGHVLNPFGRLLDLGRRAEKLAKEGQEGTDKK
jgi:CRISPR-associated protein Cmr2